MTCSSPYDKVSKEPPPRKKKQNCTSAAVSVCAVYKCGKTRSLLFTSFIAKITPLLPPSSSFRKTINWFCFSFSQRQRRDRRGMRSVEGPQETFFRVVGESFIAPPPFYHHLARGGGIEPRRDFFIGGGGENSSHARRLNYKSCGKE